MVFHNLRHTNALQHIFLLISAFTPVINCTYWSRKQPTTGAKASGS